MARSATNVLGNSIAAVAVARFENQLLPEDWEQAESIEVDETPSMSDESALEESLIEDREDIESDIPEDSRVE